jgi:hypothetical protein
MAKMKHLKRNLGLAAIMAAVIVSFVLFSIPIHALEKRAIEKQDNATTKMEILREKFQADKKLVVADNMDLTDAEAKVFWPIYQEYQTKLTQINERTRKIIDEYAKNYQNMTNEVAQKLLKESLAMEKERLALKVNIMPKLLKVLPAIKAARYYQIEKKIQDVLEYHLSESIPLVE